MDWGMKNRISRIIKPETGRTVMLAVDHGYFLGPTSSLEEPRKTIEPLIPYVDSLMLTRGVLRNCVEAKYNIPIVLRVSGGNSIISEELSNEEITVSLKEALRLNVCAVALSIYVGAKYEHQTLISLANLINEAQDFGMPVLAVTAVGKELEKRDARFLSLSCRIAAELGCQIVKTYYCEDFEKVVKSCPVPVVIAGGPKLDKEIDALKLCFDAVNHGAVGVDMGRNIWQSDWPVAMIRAVGAIVHEKATIKQAFDVFHNLKTKKKK
ncbi:MAG: 3-hydroxy-5-phosphonooxypentane-2,4-dione thiolase [Candidatus Omnitrophota bacterium]|nr:3-hydroxy-5-phosphonooxypentane-2,4-dione thiolase [Candidatus Omnitrophota bacterium]